MWQWFAKYPSKRIEEVGTRSVKGLESASAAEFDYIVVGGNSCAYFENKVKFG